MPTFDQRSEVGPWFEVGKRLEGAAAQACLIALHEQHSPRPRPYCIYVHVPFCSSRCSYCALYTRAVRPDRDAVFDEYLAFVQQAIRSHPAAGQGRPPTTVHFGGGTPLLLGMPRFRALTGMLRKTFGNAPTCEWAVETTTSSVQDETIATLKELGYQRIHLGIQTLDEAIRKHIGRREPGDTALEKIQRLQANGFLLSVDLIIGFEQSTEAILLDDLRRLYDAGIRMFSICELRHLHKKNPTEHQREIERNYRYWHLIWDFMGAHHLIPIHLGQFARSYEDNLYFTHPARGEDCLAIGPYAHGSAGRLYYANKLLPHYYTALQEKASPIGFGVLYDEPAQIIRTLESQLLAHRIRHDALDDMLETYGPGFGDILSFWLAERLLIPGDTPHAFVLSREGSWFVGNMIEQTRRLVKQTRSVRYQRIYA